MHSTVIVIEYSIYTPKDCQASLYKNQSERVAVMICHGSSVLLHCEQQAPERTPNKRNFTTVIQQQAAT